MKQKEFYYHFDKLDTCFGAIVVELMAMCYVGWTSPWAWVILALTTLLWVYKHVVKQTAVVITDTEIKIDHCEPLPWKDIKDAEIKVVNLWGENLKILSLNPKEGIDYSYNYLQKHNGDFGPFPIPLYGILAPEDEKEVVNLVKKKVKVK